MILLACSFNPVLYLSSLKPFFFILRLKQLWLFNVPLHWPITVILSIESISGTQAVNIRIKELIDQHDCSSDMNQSNEIES